MRNPDTEKLLVTEEITIRDALALMSEVGKKSLVVVDPGNRLLGTLSDGDVRRAILAGRSLSESIEQIFFDSPTSLDLGKVSIDDARNLFIQSRFDVLPIVDSAGIVDDVLTWDDVFTESTESTKVEDDVPVVIMAGGRGTRMEPFTNVLPKPLLPVNEKTVIEHIIDRFVSTGTSVVYLTVNYKSKVLKAFFEELNPSYNVNFVSEDKPLGTAGSLCFLKNEIGSTFFVTNCDVIVDADYGDIVRFHKERQNALTLVATTKKFTIPYGACVLDESGNLSRIEEKPEYELLVNSGLYVLEARVFQYIVDNKFCHMTELIGQLKKVEERVGVYPISEKAWIDVGEWPEYRKALKAFSH